MSEPNTSAPVSDPKGTFTSNEVRTFRITGPVEISISTRYESSHVPPSGESVPSRDRFAEALRPLAALIMAKLDEILANQNPDDAQH